MTRHKLLTTDNTNFISMKEDKSFIFSISVSLDSYDTKTDASACLSRDGAKAVGKQKMAFVKRQVTVTEFLKFATEGYCFCNLFDYDPSQKYTLQSSSGFYYKAYPEYQRGPNKGGMKLNFKADAFFDGSQVIFVDIDYTIFTDISAYISLLSFKPTCVYMSFSDNKLKHGITSRRFRLVYVFDSVLDNTHFEYIASILNYQVEIDTREPLDDDCGVRMSQYMNGVKYNDEVYRTDIIYSESDFVSYIQDSVPDIYEAEMQEPSFDIEVMPPQIEFNPILLKDMENLSCEDFMHKYSIRYTYFYRTENEEWKDFTPYQITDENYLQIWWHREMQLDGQKRRKKLFKNACVRRLICPSVDADTLLFNLYVDAYRFFDNSDGAINLNCLKRNAKKAMELSYEELMERCQFEIEYWAENRPRFIINPTIPDKNKLAPFFNRQINWKEIENKYDPFKSAVENMGNLDVSRSTVYRYCKAKHINTNPTKKTNAQKRQEKRNGKKQKIELFKRHYDRNLSIRENQEELRTYGLNLSVGALQNWIKKLFP